MISYIWKDHTRSECGADGKSKIKEFYDLMLKKSSEAEIYDTVYLLRFILG